MAKPNAGTLELLRAVRAKLTPRTWLPGTTRSAFLAVDVHGWGVDELSPEARAWTLSGALFAVACERGQTDLPSTRRPWGHALDVLTEALGEPKGSLSILALFAWEEAPNRNLADVHALLDKAIAALSSPPLPSEEEAAALCVGPDAEEGERPLTAETMS
jgi:hypothetical protein